LSAISVDRVADATLAALFGVLLALTGARLALGGEPKPSTHTPRRRALFLLALGLAAALLSGAFGIGGAVVMVPGMVFAGIGIHLAVGTSLVAVLGNAAGGTLAHLMLGYGPAPLALGVPLAIGAIPGTYLGSKLAHRLHADRLKWIFGAALVVVGIAMTLDALWLQPRM